MEMERLVLVMMIIVIGVLCFVLVPIILLYHDLAPEREENQKTLREWKINRFIKYTCEDFKEYFAEFEGNWIIKPDPIAIDYHKAKCIPSLYDRIDK